MKSIQFKPWKIVGMALALLSSLSAKGADIDLFAAAAPVGADAPQILFVLDNAANFSASADNYCSITTAGVVVTNGTGTAPTNLNGTAGGVQQCALYAAIKSLSASSTVTAHIGIMGFNKNDMKQFNPSTNTFTSCTGSEGGCLLMPITQLNPTNKTNMLEWIRLWATSGGSNYVMKSNNSANGAAMQESWAYLFGKTGVSGRDYANVLTPAACSSKNIIFVGNNYRNNATPGDGVTEDKGPKIPLEGTSVVVGKRANPVATTAQKALVSDTITTACGTSSLSDAESRGVYALNWARYLKAQGVSTYSIGVQGPTCNAEYAAHLSKLGSTEVGGGKYFATNNFDELTVAIKTIISEVQSVNSVFAAVSLPVSVNTQGSYLNQVYVGMFRPQDSFLPRWNGNLKQYKLGLTNGVLKLQDADGIGAINSQTGFITECARSYWTPNSVDTYWSLNESGGCLTVTDSKLSNYPDGNIVEKGAQAHKLRSITPSDRKVKTCSPVFASCTTLTDFNTSNAAITQALLNSATGAADRNAIINWSRGQNVGSPDDLTGMDELDKGTAVMRPSSHGDVVHSRPVPVNHGTDASPSIVVYYGGNDGLLRAVNGNRTSSITSGTTTFAAGDELWSFMPPEFYSKIKRLRDNSRAISYPTSVVSTLAADAKDYGFDGPITSFQGSVGGSTKTYVYATMRRGGRALYAFDVTTPGTPALLWNKGCPNATNDTGCSTDYSSIGQTWSSLKSLYATGYGSGTSPMLIMGGGYDTCEDFDANPTPGKNHNCTVAATKGNKVYVLDAATGAVVKAFSTDRAVIADATLVRDASTNMIKYAYTADMGGNVYRMTFGTGAPATWTITKIAALGCATPAACTDSTPNRKFMFAPSVATTDNVTYYVLLGSGDREKPVKDYISSKNVTNYFFMLKDKPTDASWLISQIVPCGANVMCRDSLLAITTASTPSEADLATKRGWYLGLASTEQVVTSSIVINGVLTFSTHQPAITSSNACTNNLGATQVYNVSYLDAKSQNDTDLRYQDLIGDGLPPSPVGGSVRLDNGTTVPFCIGCSPTSPLEASPPRSLASGAQSKARLYWYIQK